MMGNKYDVDGEGTNENTNECDDCGDKYEEPLGLKADGGTCPSCSGGIIG